MMFNSKPAPVVEPVHDDVVVAVDPADLIPLSHLALDLEVPATGWDAFLVVRNITVVTDDLGRASISRDNAKRLLDEQRGNDARRREVLERREEQFIQQDRLRRANMPTGIPAGMVPDGMTGAEAMVLAGEKRRPRSVREQLLEKELSHRGPELPYQSIGPDAFGPDEG